MRDGRTAAAEVSTPQATLFRAKHQAVPTPEVSGDRRILSGRYRIERELGAGGMGIVYVAIDGVGGERVAVKLLRPECREQPDVIAALREEVIKTRKLRHDNIVGVYAMEQDGADSYVVMEYLQGATVQGLLDDEYAGGMPLAQAEQILRGVGSALSFAHGKGIIHSDIKPSNIFVTPGGHAKVLDFGIARALRVGAARFDTRRLNALTPAYATEEMLEGGEPTESDDVFSLACVTYELLTGRHPFDRRDIRSAREAGLVPSPVASLSESQNRALRRGLAFARIDRCTTVHEFVDAVLQPAGVRSSKKGPLVLGLGVLGAIGLALVGAYALRSPENAKTARRAGDALRDCAPECPGMVVIRAGSFRMNSTRGNTGGSGAQGDRVVSFSAPFAVSRYPITVAQFRAFIQATGRQPAATCMDASNVPGVRPVDFFHPGFQQSEDDPVVCVTLDDARAYADWINRVSRQVGYHLVSEVEWEYSARAGAQTAYPWGATEGNACTFGNFGDRSFMRGLPNPTADATRCDDGFQFTSPVHAFAANAWGLHDMHGNVREWTQGCSHPGDGPLDGATWLDNCRRYGVIRGAGFATMLGGNYLQVTNSTVPPHDVQATNAWGFRIARSLL
jgi:formylglycine-generating enzyme required for sulfatase activity